MEQGWESRSNSTALFTVLSQDVKEICTWLSWGLKGKWGIIRNAAQSAKYWQEKIWNSLQTCTVLAQKIWIGRKTRLSAGYTQELQMVLIWIVSVIILWGNREPVTCLTYKNKIGTQRLWCIPPVPSHPKKNSALVYRFRFLLGPETFLFAQAFFD